MIARNVRQLALAAPFALAAPALSQATELPQQAHGMQGEGMMESHMTNDHMMEGSHHDAHRAAARTINVGVNFNMQIPLTDSSEQAVIDAQANARRTFYRLAKSECLYLLEEIASSCSLVSLNVNAQIQNYNNNAPLMLNAYSNAGYAITLKP